MDAKLMDEDSQRKATAAMMNALDTILTQLKRIEDKQKSQNEQLAKIRNGLCTIANKVDVITPDIFAPIC